jgi:hypothetical protein
VISAGQKGDNNNKSTTIWETEMMARIGRTLAPDSGFIRAELRRRLRRWKTRLTGTGAAAASDDGETKARQHNFCCL